MRLFENKSIYYIRCSNGIDDIKNLNDHIYQKARKRFTQIYISDNTAIIENSLFDQMWSWDFLRVVSSAEIVAEDKGTYYMITSKLCFQNFIRINIVLILLVFTAMILDAEYVFMGFFVLFWLAATYIPIQIASYQFNALMKDCIEESGLKFRWLPNKSLVRTQRAAPHSSALYF